MSVKRFTVTPVTIADGSATAYTGVVRGLVRSITYKKHATLNYTDGVDFTITAEDTGQSLWTDTNINAAESVVPVVAANLAGTGAASVLTECLIAVVGRIKFVIAAGGDTKQGTFVVLVDN